MVRKILTPNLQLRPFRTDDAEAVFAVFSDPAVGDWVGGAHATVADSRAMIERNRVHQARHGFSVFAVEERVGGTLVGEIGLQLLERTGPEVEVGWALARRVRGRGYATEGAQAWLDLAFTTLGLDEVIAVLLPENDASRRVAQRLGMEPAGHRHVYGGEHELWTISPRSPSRRPS